MNYARSLFIFRRDLRLDDNTGLIFALKSSNEVIPAFIFTEEQIEKNPLKNEHCLHFMMDALAGLHDELKDKDGKLYLFKGKPEEILDKCIRNLKVDALIVNKDYTPYSKKRDQKLEKVCASHRIAFHSFDDALLHPPEETLKKDGKPYTIFTPYFKNASKLEVPPPVKNRFKNYFRKPIEFAIKQTLPEPAQGRKKALKILKSLSTFKSYDLVRDFPAENGSTHLSPYLKFTLCSPREVYAAVARELHAHHGLIRSLYWRDFFTSIAYFFPHVFTGAFHPKFDALKWSYDKGLYKRWCEGSTGFPIVDAGMRELNETGFMHNRVRMIAASLLIKDLHIDWRWGEEYFAKKLIDYDPAVNNGNWQWVASTGCDAQPYFRIFNPWRQQKKFDPECLYIKKWIPELATFSPKVIHNWYQEKHNAYHFPIVDHEVESKKALHSYKKIGSSG
jgi:deoxyribodipyrimidine photo-lyase